MSVTVKIIMSLSEIFECLMDTDVFASFIITQFNS